MQIHLTTTEGVDLGNIESLFIPTNGSTILLKSGTYKVIQKDSKLINNITNLIVQKLNNYYNI